MVTATISQDLADLLVTKNFDPKYTDKDGRDASPGEAVVFSFDWVAPSGKNYGTAVAVIGDDNDLQFFFGDNLGRSMENPEDKEAWFKFLEQMSDFATQHRYTWSPKDINQLKHTMAGMAAIKEGLFEGYYGTRKVSYMGEQTSARLVIKHNRMLGENDKRYRYVESLFIETADGERFKLPFTKLAGGRAMLEHVRQGGKPYDIRGNHICEMVTEMNLLARFNRASQNKVFEGSTQALVETAQNYYHTLQENLKHLSSSRGYKNYFESWSPADIGSEDALVEDIKTLFVEQTLDARIESALPLLAKIQQQGTAMKEVNVFETWINRMAEGTWALPDTPEQEAKLQELMAQELPAGPDGTNATEQLYDLVGDDHLFDLIQAAAEADPNANIWDNAEIVGRLGELGVDTSAITQRGAEQTPEPAQGVAEGGILKSIKRGMQGWDKNAVGPGGEKLGDPKEIVRRNRAHDDETLQRLHKSTSEPLGFPFGDPNKAKKHSPLDLQKRVIDREMRKRGLDEQGVAEGDVAKLAGITALGIGAGLAGNYADQQAPKVEVGGVQAYLEPAHTNRIPDNAMTLTGKDGKEYRVWASKGKGMNQTYHAAPVEGIKEGRMADTDAIIQSIIAGDIDPYDIMAHPQGPEEEYVAKILEKEYEDVAIEHRLHPDDDFEQILDRVVDRLAQDYGHPMDEAENPYFVETTVAGSVAPVQGELEEGGDVFAANIQNTPEYKQGFSTGKLPVPYPEGSQEYANYYKGVIDKATPTLSKQGMAEEENDMSAKTPQDPMNYNAAVTGSFYENDDPLVRLKTLALSK